MTTIKEDLINGIIWTAIGKYSGMAVSLIITSVLARLLSPEEFGVIAIANVIIWFLAMFTSMGIGPAIIQRNDLEQKDLNNIFTFTMLTGGLLGIIFWGSSWFIANFYNNQQLLPVCQILSLNIFISAINMVPGALMAKYKRFKETARISFVLYVITGIISIIAAYKGAGVYALLISPILSPIGTLIYNQSYYPVHISYRFSIEPIKRIFSFSFYQFLFEFVNYFSRNLDKLIIGKYMTMSELGYYEKSYRLMQLPLQNVTSVINPVLQPVLSSLQDNPHEIGNKYNKIIRFISTLSFPITIILFICGYEIIHLFYGNNWDAAIPTFKILSLSVSLQMILSTSGAIFMVSNNTKAQFWVGIRNTLTTVIGFLVAAYFYKTIEAIAWAWVITLFINFICTYYIMYKIVLKISILPMLKEMIHPCINSIILLILGLMISTYLKIDNLIIMLIIKLIVLTTITLIYIQASGQYNIIALIKSKFNKR